MYKKALWYLFLFLLPWQTRLIFFSGANEYSTYSLYGSSILLLLVLVVFRKDLIASIISAWQKRRKWLYALALFDIAVFVSIFWADNTNLALYKYLYIAGAELLFLSARRVISRDFYYSSYALICGALVQGLLAMVQFAKQNISASTLFGIAAQDPYTLGTAVLENSVRTLRAYGSFGHPNTLGGFLALSLVLLLYLWLKRDRQAWYQKNTRLYSLIFISTYSFILTGLLVSFSRAGLLAFFVGSTFLTFRFYKNIWPKEKMSRLFIALIIIIFLPIWFYISQLYFTRLDNTNRLENISVQERLTGLSGAEEIIVYNPNGVGLGNYTKALEKINPNQPGYVYQPVHNGFLLLWGESGWVALLFLVVFVCLLFKKKKALFGALSLTLLHLLLFDHWLFSLPFGLILFWLILAFGDGVAFLQED